MPEYAWWATGVHPFTVVADVAVGIPVLIVAGLALGPCWPPVVTPIAVTVAEDGGRSAPKRTAPWVIILVVALSLEAVALALGGRSPVVPTLSTVVDHGLRWHPVRLLVFCGWLSLGVVPMARALKKRHRVR